MPNEQMEMHNGEAHYVSDIIIGKEYTITRYPGLKGYAVSVGFHENSCERVVIEYEKDGDLKQIAVDAVELEAVDDGKKAKDRGPGGLKITSTRS